MTVNKSSNIAPINDVIKKTVATTTNTTEQAVKSSGDKNSITTKTSKTVPATVSIFNTPTIDTSTLKLGKEAITADLEKAGTNTYIDNVEMKDIKIGQDNKVTYRVEGTFDSYEEGQPKIDYSSSQWKGELIDGKIENREPVYDIKSKQGGDNSADGLNVFNVRFGKQADGSERIVIDIKSGLGEEYESPITDSEKLCGYQIFQSINKDGSATINVELNGIRASNAYDSMIKLKGGKTDLFKNIVTGPENLADDSSAAYRINVKKPVNIEIKELTGPARLVIDFKKADQ